jgi:hypothetical protein
MASLRLCSCGNNIPLKVKIDGKFRNLQNRNKCLVCLPFGSSTYCKKTDAEQRASRAIIAKNWQASFKKRYGIDAVCFYRIRRREAILALIGKTCQGCGYNRLLKNLAFHHLSDKNFGLTAREFQFSIAKLLPELSKCAVVCHNCHGEIHEGIRTPEEVLGWHRTFKMALLYIADMTEWNEVFVYLGMPTNEEALSAIDRAGVEPATSPL